MLFWFGFLSQTATARLYLCMSHYKHSPPILPHFQYELHCFVYVVMTLRVFDLAVARHRCIILSGFFSLSHMPFIFWGWFTACMWIFDFFLLLDTDGHWVRIKFKVHLKLCLIECVSKTVFCIMFKILLTSARARDQTMYVQTQTIWYASWTQDPDKLNCETIR